jgi:hypothetical protein
MKTALLLLALSSPLYASNTSTLVLTGIISKKADVGLVSSATSTNLDLETTQSNLSIGSLTCKSNSDQGYKVTIASLNQGKLVNTVLPNTPIAYVLKVDTTPVNLSSTVMLNFTNKGISVKDINISYTGVDAYSTEIGTYSDIVTFTVSTN